MAYQWQRGRPGDRKESKRKQDVATPGISGCLQCETRKAGNIYSLSTASLRGGEELAIDAALGNDVEWVTQSLVVTREFFRLVFAFIAPQYNHHRLSRRIAAELRLSLTIS
jgi:hypothetical protein